MNISILFLVRLTLFTLDFDLTITNDGANFEPATVDKVRKQIVF